MDSPFPKEPTPEMPQPQEPAVVQIDSKCLHSVLKEFLDPLRTNDSRADFFVVYRRESEEFDRGHAKKYDEDLNTSLIFAGLFSAVSSAFIIDVQSKLEADPNEMTAAYMRILIHTMNGSLFPDADPSSVIWAGPPPEIATVQSLLYASLATSLFSAFLAMLGKQWVNRYIRNRGGSAADKSRARQRKLDGLEKWRFHLAIESLPAMLQSALLLLGCALSLYLWKISRTVAGVILTFTLLGATSYIFLTLAATLYYNCPYQTPPSILIRTVITYVTDSNATFARSLRYLIAFLPSIKNINIGRIITRFRSGVRSVLGSFRCVPAVVEDVELTPLAAVAAPPTRIFEDIFIDWEARKTDARCISWVLNSTTDIDVILSTVRFAADMVWYPEIARAFSSHTLADLFFDCLLDGRVIPGKLEHATSIGMALASVLSIHHIMEPENRALRGLCDRIRNCVTQVSPPNSTFSLVTAVLSFVTDVTMRVRNGTSIGWEFHGSISDHLSITHKLWLSRIILQTLWRWRRVQDPTTVLHFHHMGLVCERLMTDGDESLIILKTNCFLTMAISLGLRIDIRDLFAPKNNDALRTTIDLFCQRLRISIGEGGEDQHGPTWALSALIHLDPFQVMDIGKSSLSWITEVLNSNYPEDTRFQMASRVVQLVWKHYSVIPEGLSNMGYTWIPPLLGFLSLSEKLYVTESPPYPGLIALRILSVSQGSSDFGVTILPVLASILLPTHPLQSRSLALKIFHTFKSGWFSSHMENVLIKDLGGLLQAIGDPFQFTPDLPPQDGELMGTVHYEPMMAAVILIEFASLGLWRNHLHRLNFTSCEEIMFTQEGRRMAIRCMFNTSIRSWPGFLCTAAKIIAAVRRLEELQCLNTAEVVIMWAWTVGVVDATDHDNWKLVGDETLRFYQTHGIRRLTALKQHITDTTMESSHIEFLTAQYEGSPYRAEGSRRPVWFIYGSAVWEESERNADLCVSQACQLRRLYHLFGYDPTTWEEAVAVEEVDEEVSSGYFERLDPFMGWACDYP